MTKRANPDMTARRWKKLMGVWLLGWGNAFSKMEISPNGRVTALWPIHPARVQWRSELDAYQVQGNERVSFVPKDEMLHLRDIETDDSNMGKSRIRLARETLGLASAQEKFGASFFGQGATMSGFFKVPEVMGGPEKREMLAYLKSEYNGPKNWRKMGILDGGVTFEKLQVDPVDAQFLESRQFSILEICRWFGVPPHMVAEMHGAKYNNLGDQEISFQRHTMRPYFGIMASEINNSLFSIRESSTYYVEFEVNAILQMSPKEQAEVLNVARQNGIINADEWRSLINMNPIGGKEGESYIHNGNMVQTGAQIAAPKTNEKAIV